MFSKRYLRSVLSCAKRLFLVCYKGTDVSEHTATHVDVPPVFPLTKMINFFRTLQLYATYNSHKRIIFLYVINWLFFVMETHGTFLEAVTEFPNTIYVSFLLQNVIRWVQLEMK